MLLSLDLKAKSRTNPNHLGVGLGLAWIDPYKFTSQITVYQLE